MEYTAIPFSILPRANKTFASVICRWDVSPRLTLRCAKACAYLVSPAMARTTASPCMTFGWFGLRSAIFVSTASASLTSPRLKHPMANRKSSSSKSFNVPRVAEVFSIAGAMESRNVSFSAKRRVSFSLTQIRRERTHSTIRYAHMAIAPTVQDVESASRLPGGAGVGAGTVYVPSGMHRTPSIAS